MSLIPLEFDLPLAATRAIHFAASALVAGILMFRSLVARPALRPSEEACNAVGTWLARLAWIGLGLAAATEMLWLVLETVRLIGFDEALQPSGWLVILEETQFGEVTAIRGGLIILLAGCLALDRSRWARAIGLAAALALVSALAWTGHAGATMGGLGVLHLAADVLHLLAAAIWIGGLAGLVTTFLVERRQSPPGWGPLQRDTVERFSILGMISVASLLGSGAVNSWILVGSVRGLLVSGYGRLLLLKLTAFAAMAVLATVNRVALTPRLAASLNEAARRGVRPALERNTRIELALGLVIFAIVGVLGTEHPAAHLMN